MKTFAAWAVAALLCAQSAWAAETIKIGVSFSDFETERWPVEAELMSMLAAERGAELMIQIANHDPKLQNEQIDHGLPEAERPPRP